MALPDAPAEPLIVHPDYAEEYLDQLGIPLSAVYQAAEVGDLRAAEIDRYHPRGAAGLTRWIGTVGDLRRSMDTHGGWSSQDPRNRPVCVRPDGSVTLSVVGCDAATGDAESQAGPRAMNKRGPATEKALNDQFELITVKALKSLNGVSSSSDRAPEGQWFVLYHRGEEKVQLEVSKAEGFEDGQFTGWLIRVLLEPYQPEPARLTDRPLDTGGEDVDFTVVEAS